MKGLTKYAVQETAEELLENQNYVTTLEVKNELRNNNYWAIQARVSSYMQELVQEGVLFSEDDPDWSQYSQGPFQRYWNDSGLVPVQLPLPLTFQNPAQGPTQASSPSNQVTGTIDDVEEVEPTSSEKMWMLFEYSNFNCIKTFVKRNVGRNVARAYYEKTYGVPYANVGCSKVG